MLNDDRSAISRAWERVADGLPIVYGAHPRKVAAVQVDSFLTELELRLGIKPPLWWREVMFTAQGYSKEHVRFLPPQSRVYEEVGCGFLGAPSTVLEECGDAIVVTVGEDVLSLPQPVCRNRRDVTSLIDIAVETSRLYIAIHTKFPSSYSLSCVSPESGDLLWQSRLGALGDRTYMIMDDHEASSHHWADIELHGDTVFVFGTSHWGVYIEACDAKTGVQRFRFTTRID
jgi:hypothetical protein